MYAYIEYVYVYKSIEHYIYIYIYGEVNNG